MLTQPLTHEQRTRREIAMEWDTIARYRAEQIASGADVSYHYILKPTVLEMLRCVTMGPVVDIGCGVGFLTHAIASRVSPVSGVDLSEESIRIANANVSADGQIHFECTSIEEFAADRSETFTAAVANMVLMTCPNLSETLNAISTLLRRDGHLILTIPHPCFWPRYWQYEQEEWFDYREEIFIQAPFRISRDSRSLFWTTHIHRPIALYLDTMARFGFRIDQVSEPMPSKAVERLYPSRWEYPRFIAMRCVRGSCAQ